MIWEVVNSFERVAVLALTCVAVTKYRHMFLRVERIGLGLMGGCGFLTIGVIWESQDSPFDGWASSFFTFGAVLFLSGMLLRKGRHDRANQIMIKQYEARKKGKAT